MESIMENIMYLKTLWKIYVFEIFMENIMTYLK